MQRAALNAEIIRSAVAAALNVLHEMWYVLI